MKKTALILVFVVASSVSGYSATLRVPSEYQYIQMATVEADPGDTILIEAGNHFPEPQDPTSIISLNGHDHDGFTFLSESGKSVTFLNGSIIFSDVDDITIKDFTIIGNISLGNTNRTLISGNAIFASDNYCIHSQGSTSTEIIIENNALTGANEAGIFCTNHQEILIKNNTIFENEGNGIFVLIPYATVTGNTIYKNGKSGIYQQWGHGLYQNNTIIHNGEYGVFVNGVDPIFMYNIVTNNTFAGFLMNSGSCNPSISCNNVWNNSNFANGNYVGFITDQTGYNGNISVDPLFCNPSSDDYSLASNSLALMQTCGAMGAILEPGCSPIMAASEKSWGAIKSLYNE